MLLHRGAIQRNRRTATPVAEHAAQCLASNILAPDIFTTGTIAGPGTSLFITGSIDGCHCNITVDTGSDISVVRPDLLSRKKRESLQSVTSYLRTVTGERSPIMEGVSSL